MQSLYYCLAVCRVRPLLEKCGELRNLVLRFAQEQKPIAAICAAPMVLGKLGC